MKVIEPYLPAESLNRYPFRTLAGRRVLANKFRSALEAAKAKPINLPPQENGVPLTPERVIQEAKLATTGVAREALGEKVFSSQLLDLVRAYFRAAGESPHFMLELEKLPDSDFRDRVYLMILEEPWMTDPSPEGMPFSGSRGPPNLRRSCAKIIGPYLPEELLNNYPFSTLADRRVLAEKFRKALEAANATPSAAPVEISPAPQK